MMPAIESPGAILAHQGIPARLPLAPPPGLEKQGPSLVVGQSDASPMADGPLRGNHPKCPSLPFNFAAEYLSRIDPKEPSSNRISSGVPSGQAVWASDWPEGTTSVMIKNIPNRYTTEELLQELVVKGFACAFDFFYLPIDFETKRNKGYCFVNLHTEDLALQFREVFTAQKLERYKTQKVPEVSAATTQGFDANVLKYLQQQSNRIQNPWFKPMIFVPSHVEGQPWSCLPLSMETLPPRLRSQAKMTRRRKAERDPMGDDREFMKVGVCV